MGKPRRRVSVQGGCEVNRQFMLKWQDWIDLGMMGLWGLAFVWPMLAYVLGAIGLVCAVIVMVRLIARLEVL